MEILQNFGTKNSRRALHVIPVREVNHGETLARILFVLLKDSTSSSMYKIGRVPRVSRGRKFKRVTRRLSKLTENKTTSLSLSVSVSVARSHEGRIVNQKLREPAEKNRSEKKKRDKRERERERCGRFRRRKWDKSCTV